MKKSPTQIIKLVKDTHWFVQGFNGLPLYLHTAASNTGWMVKTAVGINYTKFFLRVHESRAHWYYDESDLEKIGNAYYKKIKSVQQLRDLESTHKKQYLLACKATGTVSADTLKKLTFEKLVRLAEQLVTELTMSVNAAHVQEAISWVSESRLKTILTNRGINKSEYLQLLSSPPETSFLFKAQQMLGKIKHSPASTKKKAP